MWPFYSSQMLKTKNLKKQIFLQIRWSKISSRLLSFNKKIKTLKNNLTIGHIISKIIDKK